MDAYEILIFVMIYWYTHIRSKQLMRVSRNRDNTSSLSGHGYTLELLSGSDRQCVELMRMSREAYIRLCMNFRQKGWLEDSKCISVEEKMAMFLMIIGHNKRFSVVKRRFQHSSQTVHVYFHEVLSATMKFAREIIVTTTFDLNPDIPGNFKRLRRIFKVYTQ